MVTREAFSKTAFVFIDTQMLRNSTIASRWSSEGLLSLVAFTSLSPSTL